jgi:chorismate mutase
VSQHAYDKARAAKDELTRELEALRGEITELDRRIVELQAANRKEDADTTATRDAIQREEETLSAMRQRANDRMAALQSQVAHLVNQGRALGREVAAAKQERASLQATVAQYKRELEESHTLSATATAAPTVPVAPLPAPSAPIVAAPAPVAPETPPQQAGQIPAPAPTTPAKPTPPSRVAKIDPPPADESWTDRVINWFSSLWNWIFN